MYRSFFFIMFAICLPVFLFSGGCAHTAIPANDDPEQGSYMGSFVRIYSGPLNHLRAVRPGSCPMHPTCSEYSHLALQKYGPLKGWVMTLDRLVRCGRDEILYAPRIWVNGEIKYHDSVE